MCDAKVIANDTKFQVTNGSVISIIIPNSLKSMAVSDEYVCCFGLSQAFDKALCPKSFNFDILTNGCPVQTMQSIVTTLVDTLLMMCNIMMSSNHGSGLPATPAATNLALLSGLSTLPMPSLESWDKEYAQDLECKLALGSLEDPSITTNKNLQSAHHKLHQPLCQSLIIKDGYYIFIRERINIDTYVNLQLVLFDLKSLSS